MVPASGRHSHAFRLTQSSCRLESKFPPVSLTDQTRFHASECSVHGLGAPTDMRFKLATFSLVLVTSLAAAGCEQADPEAAKRIQPFYDQQSGKLKLLKYDSNGDGKVDTWSYMDGARIVRIEIDKDGDGKIDRWEYYGADQKLEKVGLSRSNDGKEDAWSYAGADGTVARIEVSTRRDGNVTRVEHYEHDQIAAAEEDVNADGVMDKWETYEGGRLASLAFDTSHRGKADRRLIYGADGTARLEVDSSGSGQFVAVNDARAPRTRSPARQPR